MDDDADGLIPSWGALAYLALCILIPAAIGAVLGYLWATL